MLERKAEEESKWPSSLILMPRIRHLSKLEAVVPHENIWPRTRKSTFAVDSILTLPLA